MWGTQAIQRQINGDRRFIPTRVGNTIAVLTDRQQPIGSSPRMWGTPVTNSCTPVQRTVHPHACGEHSRKEGVRSTVAGSSPRMWGTRPGSGRLTRTPRFIPTHVGNTFPFPFAQSNRAVHPHACGEHSKNARQVKSLTGSSPRMWGTPGDTNADILMNRFIPTRVGNTVCICVGAVWIAGSSPRMWGTHHRGHQGRMTPSVHPHACGEHGFLWRLARAEAVHPHACGEHRLSPCIKYVVLGSSPRMWGTPLFISSGEAFFGSSPRMWGTPGLGIFP